MKIRTRRQAANESRRVDISGGIEKNPIPVICSEDIELPQFEYINEHRTHCRTPPRERTEKIRCNCKPKCNVDDCPCILLSRRIGQTIECDKNCGCGKDCINREYSRPMEAKVYLKYIDKTFGFGVFAGEPIKKGTFLGAYFGEIIEIKKNAEIVESDYTYTLQSRVSMSDVEIDATRFGNITRFYNHSCHENLKTIMAHFGRERWVHPVFVAKRDIGEGEQLTIDYGSSYFENKGTKCGCGYCRKRKSEPADVGLPVKVQRRYNSY